MRLTSSGIAGTDGKGGGSDGARVVTAVVASCDDDKLATAALLDVDASAEVVGFLLPGMMPMERRSVSSLLTLTWLMGPSCAAGGGGRAVCEGKLGS